MLSIQNLGFHIKRIKVTNVQPPFDVYYDELF